MSMRTGKSKCRDNQDDATGPRMEGEKRTSREGARGQLVRVKRRAGTGQA